MDFDIDAMRVYAHWAASSLMAALAVATYLSRGRYIYVSKALWASGAFALASLWFGGLGGTVKDHALISRADLVPLLAVLEYGFLVLGWAWFVYACRRTFTIVRKPQGYIPT